MNSNKPFITQIIKKCMFDSLHKKEYINILRTNKNYEVDYQIDFQNGFSLYFRNKNETSLVIPKICGNTHIQIHLDKYGQLVKLSKRQTDYRTNRKDSVWV
jgi:hypothetical protein